MLKRMYIKKQIGAAITVAMAVAVVSCSHALPSDYSLAGRMASISPDYAGLVIPRNIAPLTCRINEDADDFLTCFRTSADPDGFVVCGQALDIPVDRWHRLLADADTVYADIYTCKGGHWTRYTTVANAVADSIDPYISYRLIEPGIPASFFFSQNTGQAAPTASTVYFYFLRDARDGRPGLGLSGEMRCKALMPEGRPCICLKTGVC